MWRTTSILEIKAWTASISPDSKPRSLTIRNFTCKSIGATVSQSPAWSPTHADPRMHRLRSPETLTGGYAPARQMFQNRKHADL
jgi:hypothetical protein